MQNGQMAGLAAQVRGMGTAAAEAQLREQQQRLQELQSSSQAQVGQAGGCLLEWQAGNRRSLLSSWCRDLGTAQMTVLICLRTGIPHHATMLEVGCSRLCRVRVTSRAGTADPWWSPSCQPGLCQCASPPLHRTRARPLSGPFPRMGGKSFVRACERGLVMLFWPLIACVLALQDAEIERARRMVNFLENELVCERLSAEGQRAHAANLALSFQRSVQQAVASTCSMISESFRRRGVPLA